MDIKFKPIFRITGLVLCIQALVLLVPVPAGLYWGELLCAKSFLLAAAVSALCGFPLFFFFMKEKGVLTVRESLITTIFVWIAVCLASALPYMLSGEHTGFAAAVFESVSAWTTTGATAFSAVAGIPMTLSFWRAFSQWLGGAGVLVMLTLILRGMSGSVSLMKLEAPGIVMSENTGRYVVVARRLLVTYASISALQYVLLLIGGCGPFDSLIITFSSCATGGATCYHSSLVSFSPYVQLISAIFMVISSMNLVLFGGIFLGEGAKALQNSEMKFYPAVILLSGAVVIADLRLTGTCSNLADAFRFGGYQTISFASTCGLYNTDFTGWPTLCKVILSGLTFIGGCSMSTSGALKIFRVIVLAKLLKRSFTTRLHPAAVKTVSLNGKPVSTALSNAVISFFYTYAAVFLIGVFIISFEAPDLQSAFTSASSLLNNIGAGFGAMGPDGCYAQYSAFMKIVMSLLMLAGRLELYPVLLPFTEYFRKEQ